MFLKSLIGGLCIAALLSAAGDTRLSEAAMQGNRETVRSLLKDRVDVDAAQGDGTTALHWAAFKEDVDMVKMLVAAGANVQVTTREGAITPLFMACGNGNAAIVEILLKAGADANAPKANGTTPLMMAAASGSADAVKVLIAHGANVNAKESAHGQTALMFAAALNRAEVIRALLKAGADANVKSTVATVARVRFDQDGNIVEDKTPVRGAGAKAPAKAGTVVDNKLAAPNPAPIGTKVGAEKAGAEKDATVVAGKDAAKGKADGAPVLDARAQDAADAAADAEAAAAAMKVANEKAKSELDIFARAMGFQSADYRLATVKAKAGDVAFRAPRRVGPEFTGGFPALIYAAREGHMDAVKALVEGGANINEVSADKFTPLVMAITNGHLDMAKYLVDHGADVNLATVAGLTPLYATIDVQWAPHAWFPQPSTEQEKTSYMDLMKALIDHKANVNAQITDKVWFRSFTNDYTWIDTAGATVFWRAAQSSDVPAMKFLVEHGADPKLATKSEDTPLMAAAGIGWAANWSVNAPLPLLDAVKYCVELGNDVNAADNRGYTALHGAAYLGDNDMINYLISKGAKIDVKSKGGDTVADMANGPTRFGQPHLDTVALLEKFGSANSHNCRSDMCVVAARAGVYERPLSAAEQKDKDVLTTFAMALGFKSVVYTNDAPALRGQGGQ